MILIRLCFCFVNLYLMHKTSLEKKYVKEAVECTCVEKSSGASISSSDFLLKFSIELFFKIDLSLNNGVET